MATVARREQTERAVRTLLTAMGEDPGRPDLAATPALVAAALPELFSGVGRDPAQAFANPVRGSDVEVAIEDIAFVSFCEHHLLPFHGTADVRYLPRGGRVAGLGDVARAVEIASRRLQLQERMTDELADALWRGLEPAWVVVRVRAVQLCLVARGARAVGARVETVARRPVTV